MEENIVAAIVEDVVVDEAHMDVDLDASQLPQIPAITTAMDYNVLSDVDNTVAPSARGSRCWGGI